MNPSDLAHSRENKALEALILRMRDLLVEEENFRFLNSPKPEIYSFCTPLILTREEHENMAKLVELFCQALEQVGDYLARKRSEARQWLQFSSQLEEEFFFLDHGFHERLPIRRLDMAMDPQGRMLLMEINCGCPGGELDPALVAAAYRKASYPQTGRGVFLDPRDESLESILRCYRQFKRKRPWMPCKPTIALLTSRAQAHFMLPECRGIAEHYRNRGYRVGVGTLEDLETQGEALLLKGEPVHLVFRKFSTQSLRLRLEEPSRFDLPEVLGAKLLWESVCAARVCLVNPLGSTFLQDKGILELIGRENPELREYLPETFILGHRIRAQEPDLFRSILRGHSFVLKKRASYGGKHVILDPDDIRRQVPRILKEEPGKWVAQRRVGFCRKEFVAWDGNMIRLGAFPFVLSPFGKSAFVRVGLDGRSWIPINAHAGSAESFLMVEV
ncbi:MAG: hypothetical protein WHX93_08260 [bacterium]